MGSIFSGFLMKDFFIGVGSIFLGNSIFILPHHFNLFEAEFLPVFIKVIPSIFSLSGAYLAILLNNTYGLFLIWLKMTRAGIFFYSFFNQKWFIDTIYNCYIVRPMFYVSYLIPFKLLDKGFIELVGPLGLIINLNKISKKLSGFQTGLIYHYTFVILTGIFLYINLIFFFDWIYVYFNFEVLIYYFFVLLNILI
jgi:NADH-ubiquinone oxidoreductase chain 5